MAIRNNLHAAADSEPFRDEGGVAATDLLAINGYFWLVAA
jgi:hypothetical protein